MRGGNGGAEWWWRRGAGSEAAADTRTDLWRLRPELYQDLSSQRGKVQEEKAAEQSISVYRVQGLQNSQ